MFFLRRIKINRKSETRKLGKTTFLRITSAMILFSSVSLISLATFSYFVIVTDSFDMKIIFLSFTLICLLRLPLSNILRLLAHFVQGLSSISQVQKFLETENVENFLLLDNDSGPKIFLQNATFAWEKGNPFLLSNITLNIGQNCLIAVVGESKSGKTSFLRALMGEMKKLAGTAIIKEEMAFVSDNSWIQNMTLEENILFGRPKEEDFYRKTLEACGLLQDIENLPQSDETQIGEKGYALNRDQMCKVDLARAVYQNAGIYLVDDLFRTFDASMNEQLFGKVFGPRGILSNKIRIFTTNSNKFLRLVDYIIFLKDGEIVGQGNYTELMSKNEHFTEYLKKDYFKYSQRENKAIYLKKEPFSSENYKGILDPWFSTKGLSFNVDSNSFLQGEVTAAYKAFLSKILHYMQVNGYVVTFLAMLTAVLGNCCGVASLTWLALNTSEYEAELKMHTDIYIYIGFISAEVAFYLMCGIIVSYGNTLAIRKFFNWLLDRILKAPFMTYGSSFVERISKSFDNDLQYVDEEIPVGIFVWLITLFKIPILFGIIFLQYPILFLLLLYVIPSVFFVQAYYMNAWRQLHYLSTFSSFPLFNFVKNTFQGISNIRTSNRSSAFISQFRSKVDKHNKCHFTFMLVFRWLCNTIEIIGNIFIFLVVLVLIVHDKNHNVNSTGIALIFSLQVSECLIAFIYLSSTLDIDLSCLETLTSFSNLKSEIEFDNPTRTPWLTSGSIIIRNLKTDYGERFYPVLSNMSISVRPGEKVAIIGKEDSGISTILDSLFRIREVSEGQIFIDNVDISHIRLHELRSTLGIIPQYPLIFNGTLSENLDPEQNYSEEELQAVFKKSGLDSSFKNLSDLIYSNIGNDEKSKIAVARCLLKKPKIVILEGSENASKVRYFQDSTLLLFGNTQVLHGYDRIILISLGEVVKVTSNAS